VPTIDLHLSRGVVGTRSLSSGAHPRDPVALPTLRAACTSSFRGALATMQSRLSPRKEPGLLR